MGNLEDLFGLPEQEAENQISDFKKALADLDTGVESSENDMKTVEIAATNALTYLNEREQRVNQIVDLSEYDADIDILFTESLDAFRSAFIAAKDVPAPSAGKIFEAAALFARLALDAKNSKVKTRLDSVDLALKKQRLDQAEAKKEENVVEGASQFLDRNEILKNLKELAKSHGEEKLTKY